MDWKHISLPHGSKLIKLHNFTFMLGGHSYIIEIDEFNDGSYAAHGEHSTDKNFVIESVSGSSLEGCLEAIIKKIEERKI